MKAVELAVAQRDGGEISPLRSLTTWANSQRVKSRVFDNNSQNPNAGVA